jgi:hypothetical protein
VEHLELVPGITLRRVFVDMFGASMLAFAPPQTKSAPHPAPWIAVRGGYSFESRVEVAISDTSSLSGLNATAVAWMIAAVLRLQTETPVRMAVLGGMPFHAIGQHPAKLAVEVGFPSSGPEDWPPLALRKSAAITRNSPLNSSNGLKGCVASPATVELSPPPGITSSGRPAPASS